MRTPRTRRHRGTHGAIAGLAALTLVAAACGDDGADTADADTAGTEAAADTGAGTTAGTSAPGGSEMGSTMEPSGPACSSIPDDGEGSFAGMADDPAATAASNNPELSTLVAAVTAAELGDTLNGEGPFTIFAPANSAFEAIPADQLDALLADPSGDLTSILTLHVVAGEQLASTDLAETDSVATVNGEEITFAMEGDALSINGGQATVVCADVPTANATVHIIDGVLSPSAMASTGTSEPMTSEPMTSEPMTSEPMEDEAEGAAMEPSGPACSSVPRDGEGSFAGMADDPAATAASNNPELSTLVTAVDAAGLVDTLNGEGPFTIFAPANSAFAKIPAEDLQALLDDPSGALTDILTLHVVQGEQLSSADLADAGMATAIAGDLTIAPAGDSLTVDAGGGPATVVCADVPTANATVHIIDTVLLPAG